MKRKTQVVDWLKSEMEKDKIELNQEKINFINQIKDLKKEDILPEKPKNLTLWQRIKKVLMN